MFSKNSICRCLCRNLRGFPYWQEPLSICGRSSNCRLNHLNILMFTWIIRPLSASGGVALMHYTDQVVA